ncbi:hypothetical protein OL548_19860 [Lysinibacillus sp. MHQ-1]|nr:hypothetical protein OL548_19860 [Lysinibacillus sp. MHQ-1]
MKKISQKKQFGFCFFVCVATMAYINMSYEDIAPQKEEQEIKHVQM